MAAHDWVGRQVVHDPYDVTAIDIAKYAHSIGATSPWYFDTAAARRMGHQAIVAPLGYYVVIRHTMANLVPLAELTVDGMSADLTPPSSYKRRIAAESTVWFGERIVAGDSIILTKTVQSVEDKRGRSGPFAAVKYHLEFHKDNGDLAVIEDFVRILR
jgi:hydroxyacyl-ACP dehydratase HTD2-like protein with hotdog domain